jgi:hypothetical protein
MPTIGLTGNYKLEGIVPVNIPHVGNRFHSYENIGNLQR